MFQCSRVLPAILVLAWCAPVQAAEVLRVERSVFGTMPDGREVELYVLSNDRGMEARVMTLGATLTKLRVPDRNGRSEIVTLYLDTLDDYLAGHPLFGSIVGRYANRIAGARFTLDGAAYPLVPNARPHHIHGGSKEGFHAALWQAEPIRESQAAGVRLTHVSPDGQAGFPGTLRATVEYRLSADNRLTIDYAATTDKPTHVNLTNHAYFNLAGAGSGDVLGHTLQLHASAFLPSDSAKIPTGEIRPVRGTPMDFTTPHTIGNRIAQVPDANYDHCYVLDHPAGKRLDLAARVVEPTSGRVMEVFTTQPGVQLYTAKSLNAKLSGGGKPYGPYFGFCLETQHFPDAPNRPDFPGTVLRPGETYRETTAFQFSVTDE